MSDRQISGFCLIAAVVYLIAFAYDIENDRDFWTWVWLLSAVLSFFASLLYGIRYILNK